MGQVSHAQDSFIRDLIYQLRIVRGIALSIFLSLAFGVILGVSYALVLLCASIISHTCMQGLLHPFAVSFELLKTERI